MDDFRPDHALVYLVSALKLAPESKEALALCEKILSETTWNFPMRALKHGKPVEQLDFFPPSTLWVGISGAQGTAARWDLEAPAIQAVLFPTPETGIRSWKFSKPHQSVVIQRGERMLLCNAATLKPVCDIGNLPTNLTPASVVAYSPDGILLAHPETNGEKGKNVIWHLRDSATGQIIRSSEVRDAKAPRALTASLDLRRLRVLHEDGSLMEIPVSPVEEIIHTPMPESLELLHAQFSEDGNSAIVLQDLGPHERPAQSILSYSDHEDGTLSLTSLARRFPWSKSPGIWNGLMRDDPEAPYSIDDKTLIHRIGNLAPIETSSALTAVAFSEDRIITGNAEGKVIVYRLIKPVAKRETEAQAALPDEAFIQSLQHLSTALAGVCHDEDGGDCPLLCATDRVAEAKCCDVEALAKVMPSLDFAGLLDSLLPGEPTEWDASALKPLEERLERSRPDATADPMAVKLVEIFSTENTVDVSAAIREAGTKGPAAATALALALKSDYPEWIHACVEQAEDLPPLLRRICQSRMAWLQGRKAEALAAWSGEFPTIAEARLKEDWDGWEQADFQPALDNIRECVRGELDALELPEDSTPEQRKAVAEKLRDPTTLEAIGKPRFADACLKAAMALSAHKEEKETTLELVEFAKNSGAPIEPCLRAEALALTAMGDYQNAHPRWIQLITEHPVATHLPGDYAEAAYTAFENSDSRQAMEILTTGMHRFPNDANFALRAGWVSLLTGNAERAYRFLREGQRIGFPDDKRENAVALLVIAAAQSGANDDATVYFQDLLAIDGAWADAAILDTLDWPEELEYSLRAFMN